MHCHTGFRAAPTEALSHAEAIRRDVLALALPCPGPGRECFTVSIGVASLVPEAGDQTQDVIETANAALYASKADGQNRTTIFRSKRTRTAEGRRMAS